MASGSTPVCTSTTRAAARATMSSKEPKGRTVISSACTTAETTTPATVVCDTTSASVARRSLTPAASRGRPRRSLATSPVAATACSRAIVCRGAFRQVSAKAPTSDEAFSAAVARCPDVSSANGGWNSPSGTPPPDSEADAHAACSRADARTSPRRRRSAGSRRSPSMAARVASTASATPGSAASGASGSSDVTG